MSAGGSIGAFVAIVAAKQRDEIFDRLRSRGAMSPSSALALEDLGLPRTSMLSMQIDKGAVVMTGDGRYYLDEDVVERQADSQRRLVFGLLALLVLALFVFWLAG